MRSSRGVQGALAVLLAAGCSSPPAGKTETPAEGQAPSKVRPALTGVAEGQAPSKVRPALTGVAEGQAPSKVGPALTGVDGPGGARPKPTRTDAAILAGMKETPSESGHAIAEKLANEQTPLEVIYGYFSHYSPVVRKRASEAMNKRLEEAMPFIVRGLRSGSKHEIRAASDAISGIRGFFGVSIKAKDELSPELAAKVVPCLAPLLDHRDFYVRAGALHALSRCGKAAAPYLPRIAKFLEDEEWWIRDGASSVLAGVGNPEADVYLTKLAAAMQKEQRIQCLNGMSRRLAKLTKAASTKDQVIQLVARNLAGMERAYKRQRGRDVLDAMGTDARSVLPIIEELIQQEEAHIQKAEKDGTLGKYDKWELEHLKTTRDKLMGKGK